MATEEEFNRLIEAAVQDMASMGLTVPPNGVQVIWDRENGKHVFQFLAHWTGQLPPELSDDYDPGVPAPDRESVDLSDDEMAVLASLEGDAVFTKDDEFELSQQMEAQKIAEARARSEETLRRLMGDDTDD